MFSQVEYIKVGDDFSSIGDIVRLKDGRHPLRVTAARKEGTPNFEIKCTYLSPSLKPRSIGWRSAGSFYLLLPAYTWGSFLRGVLIMYYNKRRLICLLFIRLMTGRAEFL